MDESNNEEEQDDPDDEKEEDDLLDDPDFQNMSDSDGDDLPLFDNLSEDELDDEGEGTFKERERSGGGKKKSVVDDQFFKLSDMEKFLVSEDKKFEKKDEEDPEDFMDLFGDIPEEGDKRVMYKEYFDLGDDSSE